MILLKKTTLKIKFYDLFQLTFCEVIMVFKQHINIELLFGFMKVYFLSYN